MTEEEIKVLLIEDNPDDTFMIELMLEEVNTHQTSFILNSVERLKEGLAYLSKRKCDVILLDLSLPDSHGLTSFTKIYNQSPSIPIVVLSGLDDEALAIKAVREGAQDYLVKGHVDGNLISHAIRYAIERHQLVSELNSSRRMQLEIKDKFLSLVSHELCTPLSVLNEFTTFMLRELSDKVTQEQMKYMELSLSSIKQLQRMISDLLEVSRAETGQMSLHPHCVSVAKIIDETLAMLRKDCTEKKIDFAVSVEQSISSVHTDPKRLRQILINLINNSIKFTPEGGKITVKAEAYNEDTDYVCMSVADTGCGIASEEQTKIFDYLYKADSKRNDSVQGLGIGLFICKELVIRQGGQIWVKSKLKQGTAFYFTLPIFSLTQILTPVITPEIVQNGSIMLITIEALINERRSLTKMDKKTLGEIWGLIDRCILPDLDVLFPRIGSLDFGEVFFLVACTNDIGVQVLIKRLKDQLAHSNTLLNTDFDIKVSAQPVELPSSVHYDPHELSIEKIGRILEEQVTRCIKQYEMCETTKIHC